MTHAHYSQERIERMIKEFTRHGDKLRFNDITGSKEGFTWYTPGDNPDKLQPFEAMLLSEDEGFRVMEIEDYDFMKEQIKPNLLRGYVMRHNARVMDGFLQDAEPGFGGSVIFMITEGWGCCGTSLQQEFFGVSKMDDCVGDVYINGLLKFQREGVESLIERLSSSVFLGLLVSSIMRSIPAMEELTELTKVARVVAALADYEPVVLGLIADLGIDTKPIVDEVMRRHLKQREAFLAFKRDNPQWPHSS